MKKNYPIVLTIAGSDPSGGAGIQADIKSISATGSYAASVITVLTAQNTQRVDAIQAIPGEFVLQQMAAIFTDLDVKAVKIGMLYNQDIIAAVRSGLETFKPNNVVLDPVMLSKSGCELLPENIVDSLKELFHLVDLITPNIPEMEKLLNITISNLVEMKKAAAQLGAEFKTNVLLKGGHLLDSKSAPDLLYCYTTNESIWYHADRIDTQHTHGTGCTLSAAIASYLAQGFSLREAVDFAKKYLYQAIEAGKYLQIGQGTGPVDHFFMMHQ